MGDHLIVLIYKQSIKETKYRNNFVQKYRIRNILSYIDLREREFLNLFKLKVYRPGNSVEKFSC